MPEPLIALGTSKRTFTYEKARFVPRRITLDIADGDFTRAPSQQIDARVVTWSLPCFFYRYEDRTLHVEVQGKSRRRRGRRIDC